MGRVDEEKWMQRLQALNMRGKLPSQLTEAVLEAVRTHPLGERYVLADGQVPGLALMVGANGHATFWLQYRTRAGQRRMHKVCSAGAASLRDARELTRKALVGVADGGDPAEEKRQARAEAAAAKTLRAYLSDVYGPNVLVHRKSGGVPEGEDDEHGSGIYARILCAWKPLLDVQLGAIGRDAIEKVLADRKDAGLAAGTLIRDWGALRALLADAVDRGHLAAVPLARRPEPIRKLQGNKRIRYLGQHDSDEDRASNTGEARRFEQALAAFQSEEPGGGDFLRCAAGLALATGMRRGEIVRLTDKIVNVHERRVDLTPEITKSNKARTVYLSDDAIAALKLWKVRGKGGELFHGDNDDPEVVAERWEDRITQREWSRLTVAAKLEDFHFHDLRHTFAARLVMAGRPLIEVRDALGHSSIVMTERYAHLAPSAVREAVLGLGRRALS